MILVCSAILRVLAAASQEDLPFWQSCPDHFKVCPGHFNVCPDHFIGFLGNVQYETACLNKIKVIWTKIKVVWTRFRGFSWYLPV